MSILCASHLKKYYGKDESLVKALDDVNVSVENGQFVAIIGTSGSGKSTLLNMLGGLDSPTSGGVQVENQNIEKLSEEQLTVFRRKRIGFIFQNYNLIPYLTAYENIVLPVRLDGKMEDKKFLKEIVHFLELDGKLANYPSHLSGGQQQRVAIARALAVSYTHLDVSKRQVLSGRHNGAGGRNKHFEMADLCFCDFAESTVCCLSLIHI